MAEDLLGDEKAALELGDCLGGGLEQDDVVRALAMAVDGVRQSTAAPWGDLRDGSTGGDDAASRSVDDGLDPVVRRIRTQHEHEFVSAHAPARSFQWDCPAMGSVPARRRVRSEPKG